MTEREICELIVKQGDCKGISCYGGTEKAVNYDTPCPFNECLCEDYEEQAQRWLDAHKESNQ